MAQFDLSPADLATYRPAVPEPADFDDFWRKTLEEAGGYDLAPVFTPYDALLPGVMIYDVRFTGAGGQRVAAWFLVPRHTTGPRPTIIQFIGYGGGRGRPPAMPCWSWIPAVRATVTPLTCPASARSTSA